MRFGLTYPYTPISKLVKKQNPAQRVYILVSVLSSRSCIAACVYTIALDTKTEDLNKYYGNAGRSVCFAGWRERGGSQQGKIHNNGNAKPKTTA